MRVSEEPVCIHLFRQIQFLPQTTFEISRSCRTASGNRSSLAKLPNSMLVGQTTITAKRNIPTYGEVILVDKASDHLARTSKSPKTRSLVFQFFSRSSLVSGKEKLLEIREELGDQLVKESSRVIELEILVQKMQTEIAVLKGQVNFNSWSSQSMSTLMILLIPFSIFHSNL
jgi:hypothetical protein